MTRQPKQDREITTKLDAILDQIADIKETGDLLAVGLAEIMARLDQVLRAK